MSIIKQRIENLEIETIKQLIADYEQFERDGFIGDCELRKLATDGFFENANVSIFMYQIVFECYRVLANKYIMENKE